MGSGQQRRTCLHPNQRQLPEPDRGHFAALRYFTLDGTDHPSHTEQASMIRRYISWRNRNAHDKRLREIVDRRTLPDAALVTQSAFGPLGAGSPGR